MRTQSEFKGFYKKELLPHLKELEIDRRKTARKAYIFLIPYTIFCLFLTVIIFPLLIAATWVDIELGLVSCTVYFGILAAIGGGVYYSIIEEYVSDFKEYIIKKTVKFTDKSLVYNANGKINKKEFLRSKIFRKSISSYAGDDFVRGKMGSTAISFSELHVWTNPNKSKHSDLSDFLDETEIFSGLFFIADFNKDFVGETFVLPEGYENFLGWLFGGIERRKTSRGELVTLENPVFEKIFAVYGSDQIEPRYILSLTLMERLVKFRRKASRQTGTGRNVFLSFVDSKVFIAMEYTRALFEPQVFNQLIDIGDRRDQERAPRDIQQYFDDLQFAIGIVEDLNLNLRIWSKRPDVSKEPAKVVYNLDGTVNYSNEEVEWLEPSVSPKDTRTKTETVYGVPYWKKD